MDKADRALMHLYIAETALFVAHGVDSTRFGEWELFRLPQWAYVLSFVPFIGVFLYGLVAVVRALPAGSYAALALAAVGVSLAPLHGPGLLGDTQAFHTPESVAIIAASVILAVPIGVLAVRGRLKKGA